MADTKISDFGDIPALDLVNDRIPILDASGTGTAKNKLIAPSALMVGKLDLTGGTVTGQLVLTNASATGALNLSPTWNNAGTDFSLIYSRVTNTASGANSKLIDLGTVAAGSKFWVDLNGYANVDQGGFTTASLRFGGANTGISGLGGVRLDFIVSGVQLYTIDANGLNVFAPRLAAPKISFNPFGFTGAEIRNGTGTPEGSVSADPGSLYLDNGGGPPYYKNTGTGNTGWILMS